jgi:hypothetical protein
VLSKTSLLIFENFLPPCTTKPIKGALIFLSVEIVKYGPLICAFWRLIQLWVSAVKVPSIKYCGD